MKEPEDPKTRLNKCVDWVPGTKRNSFDDRQVNTERADSHTIGAGAYLRVSPITPDTNSPNSHAGDVVTVSNELPAISLRGYLGQVQCINEDRPARVKDVHI
jgi:hypothetical protein